jgi:ParB family chromosome partitioning protein
MPVEAIEQALLQNLTVAPQVRQEFDEELLRGLAVSIREVGLLQPIRVRQDGDRFVIVDGERRYRAAAILGLKTLPVIIESKPLSEGETIQKQLVANCQRSELSALEKATALHRLMLETEWSAAQAAAKLGLSAATVAKHLALLTLPESIRQAVAAGTISASAGYELAQIDDAERQSALAEQLAAGLLTRDGLVGARKAERNRAGTTTAGPVVRATALMSEGRSVTVSSANLTLDSFIEAVEDILTKARRERTRGAKLSTFLKLLRDQAKAH